MLWSRMSPGLRGYATRYHLVRCGRPAFHDRKEAASQRRHHAKRCPESLRRKHVYSGAIVDHDACKSRCAALWCFSTN